MPTFFARKLLPPAAGILLAATTIISGGQAALAANVSAVSTATSSQGSEHLLLLALTGQSPQGTILPSPNSGTVNRAALPVKIPEPSMLAGLGLVAGSLVMTRRRLRVKQESFGKNQSF